MSISRQVRSLGIQIRAGLHSGEGESGGLSDRGHDRDARLAIRIMVVRLCGCGTAYQLKKWINCTDSHAAQPIIPQRAKFICKASTPPFVFLETWNANATGEPISGKIEGRRWVELTNRAIVSNPDNETRAVVASPADIEKVLRRVRWSPSLPCAAH
jgi:hypothetical protein